MKDQYLLFAGSTFYPFGGWDDFKGYFFTIEEAKLALQKEYPDGTHKWAHIVKDGKVILWANCSNCDNTAFGEDGVWLWRDEE